MYTIFCNIADSADRLYSYRCILPEINTIFHIGIYLVVLSALRARNLPSSVISLNRFCWWALIYDQEIFFLHFVKMTIYGGKSRRCAIESQVESPLNLRRGICGTFWHFFLSSEQVHINVVWRESMTKLDNGHFHLGNPVKSFRVAKMARVQRA